MHFELTPELGAKVTSLRFGSGREWLAPPLRAVRKPHTPDQDWADSDCSGWDECFPNIAACHALGLLDHGEVWRRPWSVRSTGGSVSTQIRTHRYRLQRTLGVRGNRLLADYCLQSDDSARLDWAWAQHPLLAVDERTRLVLPAPAPIRLGSAFVDGTPSSDIGWLSPSGQLARETDLAGARGHAAKIWFEAPHPASIGVLHGEQWLLWRPGDAPDLGLWINLSGWGAQPLAHLAIEPAFGSSDDPEIAYGQSSSTGGWSLPSGGRRSWQVTIEAGRGRDALATAMASG